MFEVDGVVPVEGGCRGERATQRSRRRGGFSRSGEAQADADSSQATKSNQTKPNQGQLNQERAVPTVEATGIVRVPERFGGRDWAGAGLSGSLGVEKSMKWPWAELAVGVGVDTGV